jgi:hypothetical protein
MKALLSALAVCLPLTPAPAAVEREPAPKQPAIAETVSLRGKLIHDWELSRHWGGDIQPAMFCPPVEVWKLDTGVAVYRLDFNLGVVTNDPKQQELEPLVGKTVRVQGLPVGPRRVRVLRLEPDEYVRKTILIEARGTLRPNPCQTELVISNAHRTWPVGRAWLLDADGRTFVLQFADLPSVVGVQGLDGKMVLVTGTLDGDRLQVKSLREDAGEDRFLDHGRIEMRGVLVRRLIPLEPRPDDSREMQRALIVYDLRVGGMAQWLVVERRFWDQAAALEGRTVVLTGQTTRRGVLVDSLAADRGQVKETVQVEMRGQLYPDWYAASGDVRDGRHWFLSAGTQTFFVRFDRPDLNALAPSCARHAVTVTGVLTPALEIGPSAGCDGVLTIQTLRMD